MSSPFVLPTEEYKRDLDIVRHYVDDCALYLSKMTKSPLEECRAFVEKEIGPGGKFEFKDPTVYYLHRKENGDREKRTVKMTQYLDSAVKNKELIAATFTTYCHPSKKQSLFVDYIDDNVAARGRAKKAQFAAMQSGNKALETLKKIEQNNRKIRNNSISGSHVTPSTPAYNATGHSTLTSTCRNTSGYGNANNEKLLSGNRHYWAPWIVENNITSIINHTDFAKLQAVIEKYALNYPTIEQTLECIHYSTELYWRGKQLRARVDALVETLSPIERAAVVYTGDLYHLMKYNSDVMHAFIDKLSTRIGVIHSDAEAVIKALPTDYMHLAAQLCPNETRGKDFNKMKGTPEYGILASTTQHVADVIEQYGDLISAICTTDNVPASVAHLPTSIRRSALVSDTDSTIFTVQDWVIWHQGRPGFDDKCNGVAATMIFLSAQTITHILAKMSANFGIVPERLYQIAMKNEYKFDVFVPTQVAKHYFAIKSCQEGNLKEELENEIKGVHLKSSNVSKAVMKDAEAMMEEIMHRTMREENLYLREYLERVANKEREIIGVIRRGGNDFFKSTQIKDHAGYTKDKENSPYQHHTFWQEVWAPKYGYSQEPPYAVVKISVELDSPTKAREWIANMKDRELAGRLEKWCMRTGKMKGITTFQLPRELIAEAGIPDEIFEMIDYRRIVLDTVKVYYIVLETLGWFYINDGITKLLSDDYGGGLVIPSISELHA